MTPWDEPDDRPRPSGFGGDWRGARATFDDPMTWSLGIARVAGITIRIHVFFLVFVLAMLARASSGSTNLAAGLLPTALGLAALFVVVLLHEFGHCIACRRRGGRADEILIWPLGGLATCDPPQNARAHLWTAIGGPLVNVAMIAVLTPLIAWRLGGWWGVAVPNPLDLAAPLQRSELGDGLAGWAMLLAVLTNTVAWVLLVFNLIPMFPLDGGRIVQALLWPRVGYARSMRLACRSGLMGAVLLCVLALATDSVLLLAISLFGGVVCFTTARQVEYERDYLGFDPDPSELAGIEEDLDAALGGDDEEPAGRRGGGILGHRSRRSASSDRPGAGGPGAGGQDPAQKALDQVLDGILDKIARSGIESLTDEERATLARETERRRGAD